MAEMFAGMADGALVFQLDALYVGLAVLTLAHAVSKQGLLGGMSTVTYLFAHTAAFEHISLFLGGTHCHASSTVLPMVTPCSSINSVLFYVPWTYSSIEAARRLDLHPLAFPFAVGLLQFGFGAVYEMQGPWHSFWKWPDATGAIAESAVLVPYEGYPPLPFLLDAKANGEVATISGGGTFKASEHAAGALEQRLFKFPLLAPYFHFAFGFAWAAGLALTGSITSKVAPSVTRLFIAGVLSVVLFLPPIWITRGITEAANLPLTIGVPASLLLSFLPLFLFKQSAADKKKATAAAAASPPPPSSPASFSSSDPLLFAISFVMQAFMVSFPFRAPEATPSPSGLTALVAAVGTLHLVGQYICCFTAGGKQEKLKV